MLLLEGIKKNLAQHNLEQKQNKNPTLQVSAAQQFVLQSLTSLPRVTLLHEFLIVLHTWHFYSLSVQANREELSHDATAVYVDLAKCKLHTILTLGNVGGCIALG